MTQPFGIDLMTSHHPKLMYFFVVIKITETENLSDCNEHGDNKTRQTNAKTNISHVGGMRSPFGTYSN